MAYAVTVAAAGFKAKTLAGIRLEVDKTINLRISLEVGASPESVEVTAAAPISRWTLTTFPANVRMRRSMCFKCSPEALYTTCQSAPENGGFPAEACRAKIFGGWQVNTIVTLRGGFPLGIRTNVLPPLFNTFNVADRFSGQPIVLSNAGVDAYSNPAAFAVPGTVESVTGAQIQELGNSARRIARGPGSSNADVSIFKNTTITERYMLQFRAEFFNFPNTPTFFLPATNSPTLTCIGNPGSAWNSRNPSFGKLSSATATGRQIQFGLKLNF